MKWLLCRFRNKTITAVTGDDGEVEGGLSEDLNFVTPFTLSPISRRMSMALLISVSISLSLLIPLLKSLSQPSLSLSPVLSVSSSLSSVG
jgi:hypothetical protein